MDKYISKWDADLESGYVLNTIYTKGYVFEGLEQKPKLTFEYESLVYDEVLNVYIVTINGVQRDLTDEEKAAVKNTAINYTDTRYLDKPQTLQMRKENLLKAIVDGFNHDVKGLAGVTPSHEMDSWKTQEEEALAYINDNTVDTPLIDGILATRGKYTKIELCYKIVEKSLFYRQNYGQMLGAFNKKVDEINAIQTDADYDAYIGAMNA